jgi:hypothetical protein
MEDTTLRKKRHCTLVFDYLNYHNQISFKDNSRGDAYGCVYHAQPECAEGIYTLTHTFGCIEYTPEGINSVRSKEMAVVGQNSGTDCRRYPRFILDVVEARGYKPFWRWGISRI